MGASIASDLPSPLLLVIAMETLAAHVEVNRFDMEVNPNERHNVRTGLKEAHPRDRVGPHGRRNGGAYV